MTQSSPDAATRTHRRRGGTLWFTGLSGAGKTTIAAGVEAALLTRGVHCYRLDGDVLRDGLNADLGFSREDRRENIRRAGETARLMADAGLIVLAAFISPYREDRRRVRSIHERSDLPFLETFVDVPLAVCEERDPKGLYRRARDGELPAFTGVSAPYEPPRQPELILPASTQDLDACVDACLKLLAAAGLLVAAGANHATLADR